MKGRTQPRPASGKPGRNPARSADGAVTARLPEAYQWLLVPVQAKPQDAVTWQAFRLIWPGVAGRPCEQNG